MNTVAQKVYSPCEVIELILMSSLNEFYINIFIVNQKDFDISCNKIKSLPLYMSHMS